MYVSTLNSDDICVHVSALYSDGICMYVNPYVHTYVFNIPEFLSWKPGECTRKIWGVTDVALWDVRDGTQLLIGKVSAVVFISVHILMITSIFYHLHGGKT